MNINLSQVKPKYLFFIGLALFCLWIFLIIGSRTQYLLATATDALAMVDVLFPYYWIILGSFAALCFLIVLTKDTPRWLQLTLLSQLAIMLFYTPFLLGGFSWSPDSLWHAGVAKYFPSIITGAEYGSLTQYCQTYPFSFGLTYSAQTLLNVDTVTYSLYIFPPICIILITGLAYLFISRLTNNATAFLSMLIALPTLHYIEPHVSPFATGTVLVLASLALLTYKSRLAYALNVVVIALVIITHPISPIFIGIYMFSILAVIFLEKFKLEKVRAFFTFRFLSFKDRDSKDSWFFIIILFLFLFFFWFYWTTYEAAPNYIGVDTPLSNILDLSFLGNILKALTWTTGGQGFIYPIISQLSLMIYGVFLVSVLLIFALVFFKMLRKNKSMTDSDYLRLRLSLMALGSAVVSYLLFSSSGERFLLGRGLIFLLLMSSICMATFLVQIKETNVHRYKKLIRIPNVALFVFILFLVCSFPVISYSKEAYNTFTPPAQEGLEFISTLDLSNKTISMGYDQQLASYIDLTKSLNLTGFPVNLTKQHPEYIVMRINSYYFFSMRYYQSFSNNSYTQMHDYLNSNSSNYALIFSNNQFEVYQKINSSRYSTIR